MVIVGVDPGFAIVGWSVVDLLKGQSVMKDYGCLYTDRNLALASRLEQIYLGLQSIMREYSPDAIALEELFFHTNAKTVIDVGQARGVILLAAQHFGIPAFEYTPLQVKIALTGYGRAEKSQMQRMVQQIFKLSEIPKPDDAADALAVAYCHAVHIAFDEKLKPTMTS